MSRKRSVLNGSLDDADAFAPLDGYSPVAAHLPRDLRRLHWLRDNGELLCSATHAQPWFLIPYGIQGTTNDCRRHSPRHLPVRPVLRLPHSRRAFRPLRTQTNTACFPSLRRRVLCDHRPCHPAARSDPAGVRLSHWGVERVQHRDRAKRGSRCRAVARPRTSFRVYLYRLQPGVGHRAARRWSGRIACRLWCTLLGRSCVAYVGDCMDPNRFPRNSSSRYCPTSRLSICDDEPEDSLHRPANPSSISGQFHFLSHYLWLLSGDLDLYGRQMAYAGASIRDVFFLLLSNVACVQPICRRPASPALRAKTHCDY